MHSTPSTVMIINNLNNCESAAAIGRSPKILTDNGHGIDTPGKRSHNGALREYAWNRHIAGRVVSALTDLGHNAALIVPEQEDGNPDLEANFYIIRRTLCPSVLVENMFMDSHRDCDFLLSANGQQAIVNLHVDGICRYLASDV